MALTKEQVAQLYVSIFDRAPEGEGMNFWLQQDKSVAEIAEWMLATDDAKSYFGDVLSDNQKFVEFVYENTLGKTAKDDPNGVKFWVDALNNGTYANKGEMIAALVYAAQQPENAGPAQDQFNNRVKVALEAAEKIEKAPENYKEALGFKTEANPNGALEVDDTEESVKKAEEVINKLASANEKKDDAQDKADEKKDDAQDKADEKKDDAQDKADEKKDDAQDKADEVKLTADPDDLSGNVFNADRVWNPNGSEQLNSLNDDDVLTGTGEHATLNATIVNDTQSGDLNIMPTLNNIENVNVAFTADQNQTVDLQDATGVKNLTATRIDNFTDTSLPTGPAVTFDNIQSVLDTATVSGSNANTGVDMIFDHKASVLSGDKDEVKLTLDNVQMDNLRIDGTTEGYETINFVSTGDKNSLNTLTAEELQTLNISGDKELTLGGSNPIMNTAGGTLVEGGTFAPGLVNVAGSLHKVDASALDASLTYHIGSEINAIEDKTGNNVELEIIGTAKDDKFVLTNGNNIDAVAGNTDTIKGGEGNDTLVITGGAAQVISAPASGPNLTEIEALEVRAGQDEDIPGAADNVTVDAKAFDDALNSIYVRNEGQASGVAQSEAMTVNLNNLSADFSSNGNITIASGTTFNSGMANNVLNINLEDATGTTDSLKLNIEEGTNTDARFNFELNAPGIENLSINDNDGESNTVRVVSIANETGKIEVTGGSAGKFLNLDEDATAGNLSNGGMYGYDTTGTTVGDAAQIADHSLTPNQAHIVAATFDASAYEGDIVARFSTTAPAVDPNGAQTITTGKGNDTIIFDNVNDYRAGLTISDKVDAGEGNDTLVIDGNVNPTETIKISDSEWTNVKNFENIRLVNAGAGADYELVLSGDLIKNNHSADGLLNIINDNNSANDVADNTTVTTTPNSNVTINAVALTANEHFSYDGDEGAFATNDRIIVSDANVNGQNVIDGGALSNSTAPTGGPVSGNGDVMEIRNAAVVTAGDLANVKNIGTLEFTSDSTIEQASKLQLNDSIVDSLVESYHTSSSAESETLQVNALDSKSVSAVATAVTGLTLEAGTLTDKSDLSVLISRGANNVVTGAGDDTVTLLGNYVQGTYTAAADIVNGVAIDDYSTANGVARVVNDTIDLGGGSDTLVTYGGINLTGATLSNIETMVAHSAVVMTVEQFNNIGNLIFRGDAPHTLTVVGDGDINLGNITLEDGSLVFDTTAVNGNVTGSVNVDPAASGGASAGVVGTNPTNAAGATTLEAGKTFKGTDGVDDVFKGDIASLAGTTIEGNAGDDDVIVLTDAGDVDLTAAATDPATIKDIAKLTLANGTNTVKVDENTGVETVVGGTGDDKLDLTGAGDAVEVEFLAGDGNNELDATGGNTDKVTVSGDLAVTLGGDGDEITVAGGDVSVEGGDYASDKVTLESGKVTIKGGVSDATGLTNNSTVDNFIVDADGNAVDLTNAKSSSDEGFTIINGGAVADLVGSSYDDVIVGTADADSTIKGGAGTDIMTGGAKGDTFDISTAGDAGTTGDETITDFEAVATDNDTLKMASTTVIADATDIKVDLDGDGTDDYNVDVATGVISFELLDDATEGVEVVNVDDLITIFNAVDGAAEGVGAVEFNGDTYVLYADGDDSVKDVVKLAGLTGVTAVSDTAADDTIVLG